MDKLGVGIELIPYSRGISTTLILNGNINTRLNNKKCFVFDLDNTLILNKRPTKFSNELVTKLNDKKREIYVVTNNNRYTTKYIHDIFCKYHLNIRLDNIISTLTVICKFLTNNNYTNIFVWGNKEVKKYLQDQGFVLNTSSASLIIVLYNNEFNYKDLVHVSNLVTKLPYIIGNIDRVYPDTNILLPDTGCLWKYLEYCCQKSPLHIFGKPNSMMLDDVTKKYSNEEIVFIGDSLETDGELALKTNIDFIHVNDKDGDISHLGVLCDYF